MRRRTGAIFRDSRPATIIRSDCRGDPRNTSAPKRAMSQREAPIALISIAQQANPKVTGQIDERRAQATILSTVVSSTGISSSAMFNQQSAIDNQQSTISNRQSAIDNQQFFYRSCPQSKTPLRQT